MRNAYASTVAAFGNEWQRFDQSTLAQDELDRLFASYFAVFPWDALPKDSSGFDAGCGSGRWAKLLARRVRHLHCVDASAEALAVARRNLSGVANCTFHHGSVAELPFPDGSMDFGYSLGVLHHIPDTLEGLTAWVRKLKPGAPFLVYLYYAFDGRPAWFRAVWRAADGLRRVISALPRPACYAASQLIAGLVYFPVARGAALAERLGAKVHSMPSSAYRKLSSYSMRTDALDRFGTRLERRFSRDEIAALMTSSGLGQVTFHNGMARWCAVGIKTVSEPV